MSEDKVEITKEVMEEYEILRSSGVTNMFDYKTVMQYAEEFELEHLLSVIKNRFDYSHLLSNYNMYMEKFGVLRG